MKQTLETLENLEKKQKMVYWVEGTQESHMDLDLNLIISLSIQI